MTSIQVSLAVVLLVAFATVAGAGDGCAAPETRADVLHQESATSRPRGKFCWRKKKKRTRSLTANERDGFGFSNGCRTR